MDKDKPGISDVSMVTNASMYAGNLLSNHLHLAASQGDADRVHELIRQGASFELDRGGRSSLHYAALNGHATIVKLLADEGCSIDMKDQVGYTALHRASAQGHTDVVKVLLNEGCHVNCQDDVHGNAALHEAAWNGFSLTLEHLLNAHASVQLVNKNGFTALHLAAQNGHNQSARVLLYGGADCNTRNTYGDTPLHTASRYGHAGVTRILISASALLDEKNKNGDTALHISSALKRQKIANLLVESGAKVMIKNKQNETPCDVAKRKEYHEIITTLMSQGKLMKERKKRDKKALEGASETSDDSGGKKLPFFNFRRRVNSQSQHKPRQASMDRRHERMKELRVDPPLPLTSLDDLHLNHAARQLQMRHSQSLDSSTKYGFLSDYQERKGRQPYRDLAGNVKYGPIGYAPVHH